MNKVIANPGAANNYQATLQDFKNAFSLKGTAFKHSVAATKGALYVKDGKICSANIHGGKGTVNSSVTNAALRTALVNAFRNAGATDAFVQEVRDALFTNRDDDLSRSVVKDFLVKFETNAPARRAAEQDALEEQNAIGRKALDAGAGLTAKLEIGDFRKLAKGSGNVGTVLKEFKTVTVPPREGVQEHEIDSSWDMVEHDVANADYNASLRRRLYEIVRNAALPANAPAGQKTARNLLVEHLKRTLIGSDLKKPLSCDEIRRTLTALDENMAYVPPKALGDRTIRASGNKADLAALCKRYEKDAERIDAFLEKFEAKEVSHQNGLSPGLADALRSFSALRREMVDIGRQLLRTDNVDVKGAEAKLKGVCDAFVRNNPTTFRRLEGLRAFCANGIQRVKGCCMLVDSYDDYASSVYSGDGGFEFLMDCKGLLLPALNTTGLLVGTLGLSDVRHPDRMETQPIASASSVYIGEVVNNAAGGDCLFYSVEDAKTDDLPGTATTSDLQKANELRKRLAKYIRECLEDVSAQRDKAKPEGFRGLAYGKADYGDLDGLETLLIPHSAGNDQMFRVEERTKLSDPSFAWEHTPIPVEQVAFLASMLKRPIVLLKDVGNDPTMVCYNRDVKTGAKLEGEPIAIHFDNDHYQAVRLNEAGLAKYAELTQSEAAGGGVTE